MKKLIIISLLFSFAVLSCKKEPEPEPEVIRAFVYLYHFIPGIESVIWTVDGVQIPETMDYAKYIAGGVILDTSTEEIEFVVKHSGSGEILADYLLQLVEGKSYTLIIAGTVDEPVLLFNEIDTSMPLSGKIKFQFFHAAVVQDSIDIYMGGTTPDKRVVTALGFNELSDPFQAYEYDARPAITVTKHSEVYNQEDVLLTSLYNAELVTGANYLTVVAPFTSDTSSELTLWLFSLPLEY